MLTIEERKAACEAAKVFPKNHASLWFHDMEFHEGKNAVVERLRTNPTKC